MDPCALPVEPTVTCVVIFLNARRFLEEAVVSVIEQVGCENWELVLVDDGSSDESVSIARGWAARDDRIRYVDHPGHENRGMSASRNLGISLASGRYVVFLDSDDVWVPSAFADRVRRLDADPTIHAVLSPAWEWYGWTGRWRDRRRDVVTQVPAVPSAVPIEPPALFRAAYGTPGAWTTAAICGLMVRRSELVRIGGFDASFRGMFEDQVLYVKVFLHLRVLLDPRPMSRYRQHSESACAAAARRGEYDPAAPNAALDHFVEWMAGYVTEHAGSDSGDARIAAANLAGRGFGIPGFPATRSHRVAGRALGSVRRRLAGLARSSAGG